MFYCQSRISLRLDVTEQFLACFIARVMTCTWSTSIWIQSDLRRHLPCKCSSMRYSFISLVFKMSVDRLSTIGCYRKYKQRAVILSVYVATLDEGRWPACNTWTLAYGVGTTWLSAHSCHILGEHFAGHVEGRCHGYGHHRQHGIRPCVCCRAVQLSCWLSGSLVRGDKCLCWFYYCHI